jgi:hypothetical protein
MSVVMRLSLNLDRRNSENSDHFWNRLLIEDTF